MKKFTKKWIALLLTVAVTVSVLAASAFAYPTNYKLGIVPHTRQINDILVIGDSISAGYGLFGQWDFLARGNESHGERVEGAYPALLQDALGCRVYNMSRCQYRSNELRRIVDPEYEAELNKPENYMEKFISDAMAFPSLMTADNNIWDAYDDMAVAEDEIRKADVIILNFGSNDGFTSALEASLLKTLYYTYGMNLELIIAAIQEKFPQGMTPEQILRMAIGSGYQDFLSDYNKGVQEFKVNYDAIVKRILDVNPRAEIYYVGMFNVFKKVRITDFSEPGTLSDFGALQAGEIYDHVVQKSPYKDKVSYVNIMDVELHETVPMTNPFFYINFLVTAHPTYAGHQEIAERLLDAINLRGLGVDGNIYPGDLVNVPDVIVPPTPSGTVPAGTNVHGFTDVKSNQWFATFVDYVVQRKIMDGTSKTTFSPDKTLTRAEAVTMLYAMEGKPEVHTVSPFSDVTDQWYSNPVIWAAMNGITSGFDDNTFRPDAQVTRQQLVTMLKEYAEMKSADTSVRGDLTAFKDVASIAGYAVDSMQWAVGAHLIEGRPDGTVDPNGKTTRAEAAVLFRNLDRNVLNH